MPTYRCRCEVCESEQDFVRTISTRDDTPECCGQKTARIPVAPQVSAMLWTGHNAFLMEDGKNGGKGTWIETAQDYKKYLRDNNKIPVSEGRAHAEAKAKERTAREEAALTKAVEQAANKVLK